MHFPKLFQDQEQEIEQNVVKLRTAIILPIIGSVFLVLLFYFLSLLYWLLLGLLSLSAIFGVTYTFYPLFEYIFAKMRWERQIPVRWLGLTPLSAIIAFCICNNNRRDMDWC